MKYLNPLVILLALLVFGCDKDDPAPQQTPEEIVKEEVAKALAAQADLSEFAAAFDALELTAADVADGITAFAPPDGSAGGRMKNVKTLTPEVLKAHIIKGLIDAADLEDGDVLKALDGRDLIVSVVGEEIRINDVLISAKDLIKGAKHIVHKMADIIGDPVVEEPASLTVTVYNTFEWTPENPSGTPEEGVTVAFYTSREDYATGTAVHSGQTDAQGKLVFSSPQAGTTYYIVAEKGDLSNAINVSTQLNEGKFTGFIPDGLFQTQAEIDAHAVQPGAEPGNFRWRDLNQDGLINGDDRGFVPYLEVTVVAGNTDVEALIGYENNGANIVRDGADAQATLQSSRKLINAMQKSLVMMDGILSDDAECPVGTDWCAFDSFTFTAAHPTLLRIWNDGYKAIGQLNVLLRDVPALAFAEKDVVLTQAEGLRAYAYLELSAYFGDIPIIEGIQMEETATRASMTQLYETIAIDLESIVALLPSARASDRSLLTADAVKMMLARVALRKQDYVAAGSLAKEVIDGLNYELVATTDEVFLDVTNAEIVWDFSSSLPFGFQEYFYGRTFAPAIRLAEAYLILAETQVELSTLEEAKATMNILRNRRGLALAAGITADEVRTEVRATWQAEMSREGDRFRNLVRWNLAEPVLAPQGYNSSMHSLVAIPMDVMNRYFNVTQNPGY